MTHSGEKYFIEKTMEEAESELDPKLFIRITRQFIVCMQAIGNNTQRSFLTFALLRNQKGDYRSQ